MSNPLLNRVDRYLEFDRINRPYLAWQLDQFAPFLGERILEVGCGVGSITALLGERELVVGIEIEREVLEVAESRFPDAQRHRFLQADFMSLDESALESLRGERFDSVVCMNVLEHIESDAEAVGRMSSLLAPKGVLALLVPAHQMLYGPYDRLDGHFRRYSKAALRSLMSAAGLELLSSYYFNCIGALGWWIQYKLLRRTIHGESQFGLMNRLVPILRRVEALVRPPFGLSVIAIGQKV